MLQDTASLQFSQWAVEWETEFATLTQRLAPVFARAEPRQQVGYYLRALLARLDRKNSWHLAEWCQQAGPQHMQRLLTGSHWEADAVRDILRTYVVAHLGTPEGILVIDETGFLKNGRHSAGVARQYSGTAGRIENQQIGVFLAYAAPHGYSFIDRELYLPEEWTADPLRCAAAAIPSTVSFASKPTLAQQMLARAVTAGVPARWVVADTVYSAGELRQWLEARDLWYVLAVPTTEPVWVAGQQTTAAELIATMPATAWVPLSAGAGSQGDRLYDWTWIHLPNISAADRTHWLLARRSLHVPAEYAYYYCYAASSTPLPELVRVAGTRWVIESGFAQAKGEVGLDQYQVRQWPAWYRHITLALVAYAYLAVLRAQAPAPTEEQVGLSVPEIRRLLQVLLPPPGERRRQLWWSDWRRRHQAIARRCHQRRRARAPVDPPLPVARGIPGLGNLTEERWQRISSVLPVRTTRIGRPTSAPRRLLEGMLWIMSHGRTWRALPPSFGPWQTVQGRYQQWVKGGIWAQVVQILGAAWPGEAAG
jgi:SRSO17 transposase